VQLAKDRGLLIPGPGRQLRVPVQVLQEDVHSQGTANRIEERLKNQKVYKEVLPRSDLGVRKLVSVWE
jgi:hypothetical protein